MAISLGRFKQAGAKQTIANKLAREYEAQQRKAQKRKGWSGLLGKGIGAVLGAAATGLTIGTGGLAAPLMAAAGQFAGKKIGHELTRGMAADTSKISGGDKYGYGEEESKTLKEMLESQMAVDPLKERGGFGKDVLRSYISAGIKGDLTPGVGKLLKGEKGAITGQTGDFKFGGWGGAKEEVGKLFPGFGGDDSEKIVKQPFVESPEDYSSEYENFLQTGVSEEMPDFGVSEHGASEQDIYRKEGGYIPKYYGGGEVQGGSQTIAEYFDMKGLSLGGSNKKSIGQMLGRN